MNLKIVIVAFRDSPARKAVSFLARATVAAAVALLLSLGMGGSGCNLVSENVAPTSNLPLIPRGTCFPQVQPPQCVQTCQDSNVGYAVDNAGWLLYNQNVAGIPAGNMNKTASCPLAGTVTITGSTNVASNGVNGLQLTLTMANCGVSATSYALTFNGAVQMSGTFTTMTQNDITFSSSNLSISGHLMVLDDPSVSETCAVSMTDTWNHMPSAVGWLNGSVCGRTADDSSPGASGSAQTLPDTRCLLEALELTENAQPVEFVDVPDTAMPAADGGVAAADGGVSTTGTAAPEITSAPASMAFVDGNVQPLDLAFSDPTASRPAFLMTLRPRGGKMCFSPCCWGCRATHRVFDKITSGVARYTATTASDPATPAAGDLIIYPVSCNEPGVDPVNALTSGGGAGCTPVIGAPTPVGITFAAPPTTRGASSGASSSGGSSGGAGGSGSAGSSSGVGPGGGGTGGTIVGTWDVAPSQQGCTGSPAQYTFGTSGSFTYLLPVQTCTSAGSPPSQSQVCNASGTYTTSGTNLSVNIAQQDQACGGLTTPYNVSFSISGSTMNFSDGTVLTKQ